MSTAAYQIWRITSRPRNICLSKKRLIQLYQLQQQQQARKMSYKTLSINGGGLQPRRPQLATNHATTLAMGINHQQVARYSIAEFLTSDFETIRALFDYIITASSSIGAASYQVFSGIQKLTGLSFAYVIPLGAVFLRLVMTFPIAIYAKKNGFKTSKASMLGRSTQSLVREGQAKRLLLAAPAKIKPEQTKGVDPTKLSLQQRQDNFKLLSDFVRDNQKEIRKEFGISTLKSLSVAVAQTVTLFVGSRGVYHYRTLPVQSMPGLDAANPMAYTQQGALWFPNLDVADPYLILPVALSVLTFYNIEKFVSEGIVFRQFTSGNTTALSSILGFVGRLGGLILVSVSFSAPAAMVLYWITSAAFSTVQNAFLRYYYPIVPKKQMAEPLARSEYAQFISKSVSARDLKNIFQKSRFANGVTVKKN
ncbi:hypothetical protein V1514DRAFT_326440 [Lipomyces japonicus]|uniref:uncharacterized protein n=1 Tax=Lipomyces japonicus TaxID=56871 RepID=UPI0034CF503C